MVSRDVVFKENIFPFKEHHDDTIHLFPDIFYSLEPEQDEVPAETVVIAHVPAETVIDHLPEDSEMSTTLNDTINDVVGS